MQTTTNYAMKKIDLTDSPPDITVLNGNFDTIDSEMKKHSDDIGNKASLATTEKGSLVGAVNEVNAQLAQLGKYNNGTWIDIATALTAGQVYTKRIPLGFSAKKGKAIMQGYYAASGSVTFFTDVPSDTVQMYYSGTVIRKSDGTALLATQLEASNKIKIQNIYIDGTDLVIEINNADTTNTLTMNIRVSWEVES